MKAIKLILSLTVAISALSCTQKTGGRGTNDHHRKRMEPAPKIPE